MAPDLQGAFYDNLQTIMVTFPRRLCNSSNTSLSTARNALWTMHAHIYRPSKCSVTSTTSTTRARIRASTVCLPCLCSEGRNSSPRSP